MIKVYGIPGCNTVKKAIDWLEQNQFEFEFHDYKKQGISKQKLEEWANYFGWENILNRKGTTWAKLTESEKATINNEKAAVHYLLENTSAIKRPIIESEGKYLIRFDKEQYEDILRK